MWDKLTKVGTIYRYCISNYMSKEGLQSMTVKLGEFLSEIPQFFTPLFVKLVKLIHCPWGYTSRSYRTVSGTHIVLLATPHSETEVQLARLSKVKMNF